MPEVFQSAQIPQNKKPQKAWSIKWRFGYEIDKDSDRPNNLKVFYKYNIQLFEEE